MSEVELKQSLDNANNMLKVANAKLQAANHSLGVALAESNDVKAANILYQEREKELMVQNANLTQRVGELEKTMQEFKNKIESPVTED